jgi:D-methionine transport system substrate-binding protein
MKKFLITAMITVFAIVTAACGQADNNTASTSATLKVAATAVPHAEILEHVKPLLSKEGVNLEVKVFTDYILPNTQVFEKQMDANFFQHTPYLDQFNKDNKMNLVKVAGVHIEPLGAYSKKLTKIDELKDGATVAIPNDPTNGGRALSLLAKSGLIKLKDGVGVNATVKDIVENKKNLQLKELEAAMLPRVLNDVELALINTNFALEAKLVPTKDALLIEGSDSPYVNILVARPDNKDSESMKKLVKVLNSPEVKAFINDKYQGAVVPSF